MMKKALAFALMATLPFAAQADVGSKFKKHDTGRSIEQIYKECGIGGALFGKSSPILAIISNVTWDLGITAATSDSMSPNTCQGGDVKAAVLIKEAFPSVEKDLAAGEGEYLNALQNVASCTSTQALRSEYAAYAQTSAYAAATPAQNAEMLYSIVNNTCSL